MIKYIKEYRFYIILFLFLLIPVIALDTSTRSPRTYRFYDRIIVALTSPLQTAITWSLDQIFSSFNNYLYLWHTRKDNSLLLEENRRLLKAISNLKEAQQENIRLRKLLNFQDAFQLETVVSARVIAKDVSTEFRAIRIDRGENSGIRKDMPVLTNEGIVGRILRTSHNTSDVLTIVDPLSAVDAIDERSRAHGVVEGYTEESSQFKFTLRTDDIQPGDILISAGQGGIFPKGVPVGTVSKVNKKRFGITQEVEVHPSVNFARLEEVLIVKPMIAAPDTYGGSRD
ncbi:MAG: rod shape-determining protein MreC [Bdellovibrionota bacterium]